VGVDLSDPFVAGRRVLAVQLAALAGSSQGEVFSWVVHVSWLGERALAEGWHAHSQRGVGDLTGQGTHCWRRKEYQLVNLDNPKRTKKRRKME